MACPFGITPVTTCNEPRLGLVATITSGRTWSEPDQRPDSIAVDGLRIEPALDAGR